MSNSGHLRLLYKDLLSVSLFSCGGIGDLGFRAGGATFVAMNEIEPDRAALAQLNFQEAGHFAEDIHHATEKICLAVEKRIATDGQELFLVSCTAPCQGMSSGGMGSLLSNIRSGKRPKLDPRNRLILPALRIIRRTRPLWVVFENVVGMKNTVIEDEKGDLRRILDLIQDTLEPEYVGAPNEVEFADYGIPQRRQRLITVYTRNETAKKWFMEGIPLVPPTTHSRTGRNGKLRWVSVSEALRGFPSLDSKAPEVANHPTIPFHRVPVLDPKKYEWIRHTPTGRSAFDNQCVNHDCRFDGNYSHGTRRGIDGINRARRDTPLYCERCGYLLPRPYTVEEGGSLRIMRGYTSAYKRMAPDLPAPTISRNLSFPCSDQKIHPYENRVLSLAEAIRLQTIDRYPFKWGPFIYVNGSGKRVERIIAPDQLIRLAIAESIPPRFTELLMKHLIQVSFAEMPRDCAGGGLSQMRLL
jgi:DNA (cytosine-5)-methyltransferase 1